MPIVLLLDLENRIVNILIQDRHDDVEREKIKFGVRLIFDDLWKVAIIYLVALSLGCFYETLVTHGTFSILRQVCFGFHFQNSIICLIASILSLPIGVFLIQELLVVNDYILFLAIISTLVLVIFAPVATDKRPIFSRKHRDFLRKKILTRLLMLWIIILIVNKDFQNLVLYALILIAISVLTQKVLGGNSNEN